MTRLVAWQATTGWRAEMASVTFARDTVEASGTQLGVDPLPYRLAYRLETGPGFVTRRLVAEAEGEGWWRSLDLRHGGRGSWTCSVEAEGGAALAAPGADPALLAGALDCDLAFSPLTNLMPVRRHALHERPGAVDLDAAWVGVPDLSVRISGQRYEHVATGRVRYVDQGLFAGFEAVLELDGDGLVTGYPGLAARV